jgi:hypothetical protein
MASQWLTESLSGFDTSQVAHAKAIGATVVFAKFDRLTRNVDLLRSLVASDVDLVFYAALAPSCAPDRSTICRTPRRDAHDCAFATVVSRIR